MNQSFKSVVYRFYAFQLLSGMHFFGPVMVPFFEDWGHVNQTVIQGLQSWFTFWIFALEVPTGVIADRLGRKHSVVLGCLACAIATLVYGSFPHLWVFALGEFLFALGAALISGADKALVYDSLLEMGRQQEARGVFGKSRAYRLAGTGVGALFGGMIAQKYGLNAPMLMTFVPIILSAFAILSIAEPTSRQAENEIRNFWQVAKVGMAVLKSNRILLRWTINSAIVSTSAYFAIWLYQPLMKKLGLPLYYYGVAQVGLVAVEVLIASNFESFVKLFRSTSAFANFSTLVTIFGFLVVWRWPCIPTLVIFLVLSGGFGLTRQELILGEMNCFVDSSNRATTLSAVSMVQRVLQTVTNPFVGNLVDRKFYSSFFWVGLIPFISFFAPIKKEDEK